MYKTKKVETFLLLGGLLFGSFLFNYWFDNPEFRKNLGSNIQFADMEKLNGELKEYGWGVDK